MDSTNGVKLCTTQMACVTYDSMQQVWSWLLAVQKVTHFMHG